MVGDFHVTFGTLNVRKGHMLNIVVYFTLCLISHRLFILLKLQFIYDFHLSCLSETIRLLSGVKKLFGINLQKRRNSVPSLC